MQRAPLFMAALALFLGLVSGAEKKSELAEKVLSAALAGPLKSIDEIIFVTRMPYNDGHWYANIGYYCEDSKAKAYAGNGAPDSGSLCKLNMRSGQLTVLLDGKGGSVRDPQVHYDGRRILFSYRKAGSDYYNLYEIETDGTGLRQITSGAFDDYEPIYLPDDDIVFVSTRCRRWVGCWKTQVGVLHRCSPFGTNIRSISCNIEHDNTPWMMPDGRLLYTRWEYVDRSQMDFHHLWTMFPDGTEQAVYYGNQRPGTVMIDAKPIPGTNDILASFSPGHGVNEHAGRIAVVSPDKGPDDPQAVRIVSEKLPLIRDPYPLSKEFFLAARDNKILLIDGRGNCQTIYTYTGQGKLNEPRPIQSRIREPMLSNRVDAAQATGTLFLADVYNGRNMGGVQRGEIRKLLVLETLPKPVNFSGGPDLTSWSGTFNLERVLGTVPVEEDGSAFFQIPAGRPVFFVALDKNDLSVKRMQSFTSVMPGERQSCVGCHETRSETPVGNGHSALAVKRAPSTIKPFEGFPSVLDFNRDVQPILDRHCVSCHNPQRREGRVSLSGDIGPHWSHSYFSLIANLQVADGRNGLGEQPPRAIGSSSSALLKKTRGAHHGAELSSSEWRMLWLWIESGAPYAGTYSGLRNAQAETTGHRTAGKNVFAGQRDVLQRRCSQCHDLDGKNKQAKRPLPIHFDRDERRKEFSCSTAIYERLLLKDDLERYYSPSILLNLTRPEMSSLLLAPLASQAGGWQACGAVFQDVKDIDYQRLLEGIQNCKKDVEAGHQFGTAQFRPNPQYVREMKRYGVLPYDFDESKTPVDVFATDEKYWRLFWHVPSKN